jgi:hypothetical protein
VLRANVGGIEGLRQVGPGEFRARYVLPATRYPEVAVIVGFAPWPHPDAVHGSLGSLLLPLATQIDLPLHTERNAQVTLEIAGVKFGPVASGAEGKIRLPVIIPPGHRYGRANTVDKAGNRRASQIDLMLPPTDPIACVMSPPRLPAEGDARARVLCAASDPYGKALPSASIQLRAQRGAVEGPRRAEGGILEWTYRAPRGAGAGTDRVSATLRLGGGVHKEDLEVALVQGPPASGRVRAVEPLVHYGGRVTLQAEVKDALEHPRSGAQLAGRLSEGTLSASRETKPGQLEADYLPPAEGASTRAKLSLTAVGPFGTEPADVRVWEDDGHLFAGVVDQSGLAVPSQPLVREGAGEVQTNAEGWVDLGPKAPGAWTLRHAQWKGLRRTVNVLPGGVVFPSQEAVRVKLAPLELVLAPPVPVNVRVAVRGTEVQYWAEDASGKLLADRTLDVTFAHGTVEPLSPSEGKQRVSVKTTQPTSVSVSDRQTGVTAVARVAP